VARVDKTVGAAVERVARGAEVERRRYCRGTAHQRGRVGAALAEPLEKRIAAEGDADCMDGSTESF
jgi:hypothetical protein